MLNKNTKAKLSVVGSGAKTNKKSILTGLFVLLLIAALGYGGFYFWQVNGHKKLASNFKTHAASYGALIGADANVMARACWKPYSSSKPDEVWLLVSRRSPAVEYTDVYVDTGNYNLLARDRSSSWWSGNLQLYKLPVGRANIYNGAFLIARYNASNSLTSAYSGPRNNTTGSAHYPLVKNLPSCDY
jgi:hypothetical protein